MAVLIGYTCTVTHAGTGALKLTIQDKDTGQPLSARMQLKNSLGRSIFPRASPSHADFFIVVSDQRIPLASGAYEFVLEKGPEFRTVRGNFSIERGDESLQQVTLERIVDLQKEGWWAGDLMVNHPADKLLAMMDADGVHVACVAETTRAPVPGQDPQDRAVHSHPSRTSNGRGPWIVSANRWVRHGGGDLGLLGWDSVDSIPDDAAAFASASTEPFLARALGRQRGETILAMRPYAWDLPVWLARQRIDAICLMHGNLRRDGVVDEEDHGRPRDRVIYPPAHGNARWSQRVYFEALNAGFRFPPVAASESGFNANPVGYNRVYVHCDQEPTQADWWENLREGRVFVTNGPLLRVRFNGRPPGYRFVVPVGQAVTVECEAELATRERIAYLQVIRNGQVIHDVRLESLVDRRGRLPEVTFDRSGWMAVRAVTVAQDTYRAACTGPIYVQIGDSTIAAEADATFWADWIRDRSSTVRRASVEEWKTLQEAYRQTRDVFAKLPSHPNPGTPPSTAPERNRHAP